MVNTLRRKMFKMGGNVPKAHGVGITSNLKMKKGGMIPGKVGEPIFTKQGPDGKEREMQNPLALLGIIGSRAAPFLFTGGRSALGAGRALRGGLEGLKKFFKVKPTGPRGEAIRETGRRGSVTIRSAPRAITGMDRVRQAARIGATGLGGAAGLGGVSALAPRIQDPQSIGAKGLETVRGITEGALDLSTLIPSTVVQLGRTPEDLQGTAGLIRSTLYGDSKAPMGDDKKDQTEQQKPIQKQKDEFAGLQDKAERMAAAISRENNLATLSRAASDFGAAALSGEDFAESLRQGSAGIFDELGRRRDLQENIGGILAQQVLADEATQGAMIAEAAKTGDPAAVNRMQKYFDAYNEGVTNILPLDTKGGIDYANMAPGTVYMDLEGVSGARYVASNSGGDDTQSFDSIEDANAFSQS